MSRRGVLGGHWGFLTGDLEDRVILDTMDDLGGPQGSYPEGFVSLSLFLAEIYKLVVLVNMICANGEEQERSVEF